MADVLQNKALHHMKTPLDSDLSLQIHRHREVITNQDLALQYLPPQADDTDPPHLSTSSSGNDSEKVTLNAPQTKHGPKTVSSNPDRHCVQYLEESNVPEKKTMPFKDPSTSMDSSISTESSSQLNANHSDQLKFTNDLMCLKNYNKEHISNVFGDKYFNNANSLPNEKDAKLKYNTEINPNSFEENHTTLNTNKSEEITNKFNHHKPNVPLDITRKESSLKLENTRNEILNHELTIDQNPNKDLSTHNYEQERTRGGSVSGAQTTSNMAATTSDSFQLGDQRSEISSFPPERYSSPWFHRVGAVERDPSDNAPRREGVCHAQTDSQDTGGFYPMTSGIMRDDRTIPMSDMRSGTATRDIKTPDNKFPNDKNNEGSAEDRDSFPHRQFSPGSRPTFQPGERYSHKTRDSSSNGNHPIDPTLGNPNLSTNALDPHRPDSHWRKQDYHRAFSSLETPHPSSNAFDSCQTSPSLRHKDSSDDLDLKNPSPIWGYSGHRNKALDAMQTSPSLRNQNPSRSAFESHHSSYSSRTQDSDNVLDPPQSPHTWRNQTHRDYHKTKASDSLNLPPPAWSLGSHQDLKPDITESLDLRVRPSLHPENNKVIHNFGHPEKRPDFSPDIKLRSGSFSGREESSPAKIVASSPSADVAQNGNDLNSSFSASRIFASPYSSSSSPSPPPGPSLENPDHEDGVHVGPSSPEKGRPRLPSLTHSELSPVPLSGVHSSAVRPGWSPFHTGRLGDPGPRLPMIPSFDPSSVAAAAAAAAAAAVAATSPSEEVTTQGQVYCCHLCDFTGSSKTDFDSHMSVHYKFDCPQCDYKSRTEGRLLKHISDFHSDPSKHKTAPSRPKLFKCKQCDFTCTDRTESWTHRRLHIKEEKRLECPQCPFVTEYKHHLEYHLLNHLNSKPHKCPKCNYSCVNKSMLNSHMKSHTKACQFRCADCSFAAKYSHSMKIHLQKNNHRLGAVLNSDGSLPQPEISAGSRKGPLRLPSKEGDLRDGLLPGLLSMPHSPRLPPVLPNPLINSGMFPFPFLPFMAAGGQGPLPFFNMRSLAGPGHGLPPTAKDLEKLQGAPLFRPDQHEPGHQEMRCMMCGFPCDSVDSLREHMLNAHTTDSPGHRQPSMPSPYMYSAMPGSEGPPKSPSATVTSQSEVNPDCDSGNGDQLSPAENTYIHHSKTGRDETSMGPVSTHALTPMHQSSSDSRFRSENKAETRPDNTLRREDQELNTQYEMTAGRYLTANRQHGEDVNILQQMTQRFGEASTTLSQARGSRPASPKQDTGFSDIAISDTVVSQQSQRQIPQDVDVEGEKGSQHYTSSNTHPQQASTMQDQHMSVKRPATDSGLDPSSNSSQMADNVPLQPRKRSRKGKAFKLDELYLKRQEQQQQLESSMKHAEDVKAGETRHTANDNNPQTNQTSVADTRTPQDQDDPSNSGRDEEERFRQLQKDIQILNNDASLDSVTTPNKDPTTEDRPVCGDTESPKPETKPDSKPEGGENSTPQSSEEAARKEDNPIREQIDLVQLVCKTRREPVPASVRRGCEVAWKMLTDPSMGLELPADALAEVKKELLSSRPAQAPALPATTPRHHSFSATQKPATVSPEKRRLSWSLDSPSTMTSARSDVYISPPASADARHYSRRENGIFPSSLHPPSWMKLNMPLSPFSQRSPRPMMDPALFSPFSHRSSTSSQTLTSPRMAEVMHGPRSGLPPPGCYPARPVQSYECGYCEMSFKDQHQYRQHMWFHSTDNPFECRGCGHVSRDKLDFYRHLLTVKHT